MLVPIGLAQLPQTPRLPQISRLSQIPELSQLSGLFPNLGAGGFSAFQGQMGSVSHLL